MQLKSSTIGSLAAKVHTPAGIFSGTEFAKEYREKEFETNLSYYGYHTLCGNYSQEEERDRIANAPKNFLVRVEGFGWCEAITEFN